jgi:hypothetical protein
VTASDPLALGLRAGLPDGLQVLVRELPRLHWPAHPRFRGLASFWLDRHLEFRKVQALLAQDAAARLAGNMDPADHARRLSRLGGHLLDSLHGHHQIEDAEYFPLMATMDARVSRGFDLLEADHTALDGALHRFADAANAVLKGDPDAAAHLADTLGGFARFLDRHLEDEEDIVIPLILRSGL